MVLVPPDSFNNSSPTSSQQTPLPPLPPASSSHLDLRQTVYEPSFDLLVVGCGGGPLETNLSCYLVKARQQAWKDGCAALEGGSTIGAIASLIERYPQAFEDFDLELEKNETIAVERRDGGGKNAGKVWESIRSFSITHAHLDHIAGLVISSAAVQLAPKSVYGLPSTIQNLENIMNFGVWPNLGTRDATGSMRGKAYVWRELEGGADSASSGSRFPLARGLTATAIPVSHGTDPAHSTVDTKESYVSTAFFVRNEETMSEFLFFGDVEPDSISCDPRTRKVWEAAAPKIVDSKLNVIFLECSYPSSQPQDKLFGHLSPPFVLEELQVLSGLVQEERQRRNLEKAAEPLAGVHVVIQHIKDDIFTPDEPSSPAPKRHKPHPLELVSTTMKGGSPSDSNSPLSPLSPLSMSPPIATVPLRRPSVQLSQSSFPPFSANSSPVSTRRGSPFQPPPSSSAVAFSSPFVSPSRKSSASSTLAAVRDDSEEGDFVRRNSTPGSVDPDSTPRIRSPQQQYRTSLELSPTEIDGIKLGDGDEGEEEELKVDLVEETVHERIERELNELEEKAKTGVRFVIARQGMRLLF
ncbi:3',5'-cyclic-nucleotide phosphodiesterase PDE1 [Sporobolomyces salmoneus]|uniref:3',5'-cyclic-nucleotide phosphodiesterase PDE1 n=1 Tax=Sporobolomyces salmoneus TaxID=183962 RepID=UPI00317B0305